MQAHASAPLWIFAYGSLIWRPGFAYVQRARGYVRGWSRRFWQGSTDHRGLPGAPGRVLTVTPDGEAACWGIAYRLEAAASASIVRQLDIREQGGYERCTVEFHCAEGERGASFPAFMYVAGPDNPNYLGPAPLERMAAQVRHAHGPSGSNREYVLELQRMLAALEIEDAHVSELAALVGVPPAPPGAEREAEAESAEGARGRGLPVVG